MKLQLIDAKFIFKKIFNCKKISFNIYEIKQIFTK